MSQQPWFKAKKAKQYLCFTFSSTQVIVNLWMSISRTSNIIDLSNKIRLQNTLFNKESLAADNM